MRSELQRYISLIDDTVFERYDKKYLNQYRLLTDNEYMGKVSKEDINDAIESLYSFATKISGVESESFHSQLTDFLSCYDLFNNPKDNSVIAPDLETFPAALPSELPITIKPQIKPIEEKKAKPLRINYFRTNDEIINKGDSIILTWSVSGDFEGEITLTQIPKTSKIVSDTIHDMSGKKKAHPIEDTSYVLSVNDGNTIIDKKINVSVVKPSKAKPFYYKWLLPMIAIAVIIAIASFALINHKREQHQTESINTANVIDANKIPGLYSVTYLIDSFPSQLSINTEIRFDSENDQYTMTFISQYAPEFHTFKIANDKLESPTLGIGSFEYKKYIDRTIITFNNKQQQWILKK